jgi:predicted phage terminase large subunit-like protein
MTKLDKASRRALKIELARKDFWEYCRIMIPAFYKEDRQWLKDMCYKFHSFYFESDKFFLVINAPPRFGKSLTAQKFTEWLFGRFPMTTVMTGSYNEILAGQFAKNVRNMLIPPKAQQGKTKILYHDIFPDTMISKGDASASLWKVAGSPVTSYLATSPGGTATGIGAKLIIIDDLIKSPEEAYNDNVLDRHWEWFNSNMMQRLEGNHWKVIVIATRWVTEDLPGKVIKAKNCDVFDLKAYEDVDGKRIWTCEEILDERSFEEKCSDMNEDIILANYQQQPMDLKGRLFSEFMTYKYKDMPEAKDVYVKSVTDTADKGTDSLCSIIYKYVDGIAYVLDVIYTDAPMEQTERLCAEKFDSWGVKIAFVEANNGGRLFAENIRRAMTDKSVMFDSTMSTSNKEARILASHGWLQRYIRFPEGWNKLYPEFYNEVMTYNAKGKNKHDDGVDTMALLYGRCIEDITIKQSDYTTDNNYMPIYSLDEDFDEFDIYSSGEIGVW